MEQLHAQPQQTFEQPNLLERYGRQALAVGISVLALASASKAEASTAKVLPAKQIGNLYTPLTPQTVLTELGQDPATNPVINIGPAEAPPGTLNTIGQQLITSIPGQSIDLKQSPIRLNASNAAVTESFVCPNPRSTQAYPAIQTVEIDQGNKARLTFCPSTKSIGISSVNFGIPLFNQIFNEFKADPVRNTPWGGDQVQAKTNLYFDCPGTPFNSVPDQKVTFTPQKGMRASFQAISTQQYCDKVGQYSTEATAQIRKAHTKTFKQLGQSVLHVDGLKEVLVFGSTEIVPIQYSRVSLSLQGTKVNCNDPGMRHASVRLKLSEKFQSMWAQQFLHATDGVSSAKIKSNHRTYYTKLKQICS
jgi:hypothetical protein